MVPGFQDGKMKKGNRKIGTKRGRIYFFCVICFCDRYLVKSHNWLKHIKVVKGMQCLGREVCFFYGTVSLDGWQDATSGNSGKDCCFRSAA